MFFFGAFEQIEMNGEAAGRILDAALARRAAQAATPLETIVEVLQATGNLWQPNGKYWKAAAQIFANEGILSPQMVEASLAVIPELLCRETLLKRVTCEFGHPRMLDEPTRTEPFPGRVRALPLGVVLHVTAGNVFLGAIDSLVMGFLTKNVNVLKLSSRSSEFPFLFAQSLLEADPHGVLTRSVCIAAWKGGDASIESHFQRRAQGILAWGGQEMLATYSNGLAPGVKLIDFGPRISIQMLTRGGIDSLGYEETGARVAKEMAIFDGQACNSPQNCFVESGVDMPRLLACTAEALRRFPIPRARLSDDECVEIHKERARGRWSRVVEGGWDVEGDDFYLHFDPNPFLRPSPQNRTLIFKTFSSLDHLVRQLEPFASYLQSCSILTAPDAVDQTMAALGLAGMKRFTPLGSVMEGMNGAPHDGTYALRELVSFVGHEAQDGLSEFLERAVRDVPFYNRALQGKNRFGLSDFPLIDGSVVACHSLPESRELLSARAVDGYIFSSGGTSGAPKHAFYSHEEFRKAVGTIVRSYLAGGLRPGMTVANLFAAGHLWSSFLVTDKALEQCGARQLPMGGLADVKEIVACLQRFKPDAVCGLPSLIVSYAQHCADKGISLHIPRIFYAGEHCNAAARAFLQRTWGTTSFHSAGYASVDAGPIGWQCAHCQGGEHHLIEEYVTLEVIDEEAVVTSRLRDTMPIIRYRTGDRVSLLPTENACPCGSFQIKFMLLGRLDGLINIWSARVNLADVEKSLADAGLAVPNWQVELSIAEHKTSYREVMILRLEEAEVTDAKTSAFLNALMTHCADLAHTLPREELDGVIALHGVKGGEIPRVERTGKIRKVLDRRGG